jgi:hypothetical protein
VSTPARVLHGSCLCGGARFEIEGRWSAIGQCHCSKCRKVSGTASNAVLYTAAASLRWVAGEGLRRDFSLPSGWGTTFCGECGSPLPRLHPNGKIYFVPAGVLDDDPGVAVERHIFVGSKASWDAIAGDAPRFEGDDPSLRR